MHPFLKKIVLGSVVGFWIGMIILACGTNLYKPLDKATSQKAKMEEARVLLDKREFSAASQVLERMTGEKSEDSNEVRLLLAAAKMGVAGFDLWNIIAQIRKTLDSSSSSKSSLDTVLSAFTDNMLGTGEERTARLEALDDAIDTLRSAPDPTDTKVLNTACFLGAIMVVPTISNVQTFLNDLDSALAAVTSSNGGSTCSNTDAVLAPFDSVGAVAQNITKVIDTINNCPILGLDQATSSLNTIEKTLKTMLTNADKGCASLPSCPAAFPNCNSLFPTCVQDSLGIGANSAAKANDGTLDACEMVLFCQGSRGGSCF